MASPRRASSNSRDPVAEGKTRVIRIPYEALRNGDLRYNIVVKPYDLIIVPRRWSASTTWAATWPASASTA